MIHPNGGGPTFLLGPVPAQSATCQAIFMTGKGTQIRKITEWERTQSQKRVRGKEDSAIWTRNETQINLAQDIPSKGESHQVLFLIFCYFVREAINVPHIGKKNQLAKQKTHHPYFYHHSCPSCSIFSLSMKYRGSDTKVAVLKQCVENIKASGPDHTDTRTSFQPPYISLGESSHRFLSICIYMHIYFCLSRNRII